MGIILERLETSFLERGCNPKGQLRLYKTFSMQPEKTPLEVLQENYDLLTKSYETVSWLKNVYEQKTKIQNTEIELLKQGKKSPPAIAFIDFKKAEVLVKPSYFELQMLN